MRLGFSRGRESMRQVVRQRGTAYDLQRPDDAKGRFGESDSATTTVSDVALWLQFPRETNVDTQYGIRLEGDMIGRAQPDADVQPRDILTHGGEQYEVAATFDVPDEINPTVKLLSLDKITNDGN